MVTGNKQEVMICGVEVKFSEGYFVHELKFFTKELDSKLNVLYYIPVNHEESIVGFMYDLLDMMECTSSTELNGKFCTIYVNEKTGKLTHIKNANGVIDLKECLGERSVKDMEVYKQSWK